MLMHKRIFRNRTEAGRRLANALDAPDTKDAVVLALPRGGVVVAAEIAQHFKVPLDVILVRKLGTPEHPELAIGAIVDGDVVEVVLNTKIIQELGVPDAFIQKQIQNELKTIEHRRKLYVGGRSRPTIGGRSVILVDDGLATGATMRAALAGVRKMQPSKVIIAVPIGTREVVDTLKSDVDKVICFKTLGHLGSVGAHYADFSQVDDQTVIDILEKNYRHAFA